MTEPLNLSESSCWDVIVIGAGAAGLMAAASAARRGRRTLLLEKNRKIGVKILMSGGTRCNITHHCDTRGIAEAFGANGKFLHSALAALSPTDVIQLIEAQGVATKVESTGKIFPVSDRAIDVRDALWRLAEQAGASILPENAVEQIETLPVAQSVSTTSADSNPRFSVQTTSQRFAAHSVVITTGGKSYPGCGTTGDGYTWAQQFGHSIVTPVPALTPILSNCQWALDLKGVTLDPVLLQVWERAEAPSPLTENLEQVAATTTLKSKPLKSKSLKAKLLDQRTSSLLFTHWGFSGPAALDVSRVIARHPQRKQLELVCDFWPHQSTETLTQQMLQGKLADPKQLALHLLPSGLPRRFLESLMQVAGVDVSTKNSDLSKKEIGRLVKQLKQTRFPTTGTLGFEKAEVTAGGVTLKEIDSKTMQSKRVEGLFFAGEVLDLDGRIGGFNFQSAFSTGWLAGKWA